MLNYNNLEKEFFIIESENLEKISNNFFGYAIQNNNIIFNQNYSKNTSLNGNGVYISINVDSNQIILSQDFNGSFGLFLYKNEEYFALSNSFIKLEKFIKEKYSISLNEDYANTFFSNDLNISFDETILNEINIIPKDYKVIIDIESKKLTFEKINFNEKTIELLTEKGINCLDQWFNNWIQIIRGLIEQKATINLKLNGTLSSRVLLALLLNVNADLKNVKITYNPSYLNDDDLNIMSNLSKEYNFDFSNNENKNISDIETVINNSFYTSYNFNKEINNEESNENLIYNIEDMNYFNKEFNNKSIDDLINFSVEQSKDYFSSFGENTERFYWKNIHKLQKHLKIYDIYSASFLESLYTNTVFRNSIARKNVEKYLANIICLNPLLDINLQKLNSSKHDFNKLFFVTILLRYCPELLNISFSDETINQEIIDYAKELNEKYPYKMLNHDYIGFLGGIDLVNNEIEFKEVINLIKKIFCSNSFKHTFLKYYPIKLYNKIIEKNINTIDNDYRDVYASITIIKILEDVEYNKNKLCSSEYGWIKSFITKKYQEDTSIISDPFLNQYRTARIDIKNEGSISNQIKIYDISDENSYVNIPDWFTNEQGVGVSISSYKSKLSFKIKCINDGDLKIYLRTLDVRDRNNKRFPIYIDYLSFKMDNHEYLKENKLIWHDNPLRFSKKVYDGEIIQITLQWRPFSHLSNYE